MPTHGDSRRCFGKPRSVETRSWQFPDLDILFIESGGDNLAATFSPDLVDATIYVIDVAEGDKIPRKGGPGIMTSGYLVINKIDLVALRQGRTLMMDRDAKRMRGREALRLFTNLQDHGSEVDTLIEMDPLFPPVRILNARRGGTDTCGCSSSGAAQAPSSPGRISLCPCRLLHHLRSKTEHLT